MAIKRVFLTTVQELFKQKSPIISNQTKYYVTNKHVRSLTKYKNQIKELKSLSNIEWIANYKSALHHLNKNQLSLIVGDPHPSLHHQLLNQKYKFITLQEITSIFPIKVPLSYRSQDPKKARQNVENRLNISLDKQPKIQSILLTSHQIKLWDQALQVLLDLHQQKKNFIVEYDFYEKSEELYRLNMGDFLSALRICYKTIHNQEQLNIIDYNQQNKQVQWLKKLMKEKQQSRSLQICKSLY